MNGTERIKTLLAGKPADKINTATWMHVPAVDRDTEAFAKAIIDYAEDYGSDLIKVQLNAAYLNEAYGAKIDFFENPPLKFQKVKKLYEVKSWPINSFEDLKNLKPIFARENPVIQRDVEAVRRIVAHYGGTKPVLPTLFSAYSWLHSLTRGGEEAIQEYRKRDKQAVHRALEVLNDVNRQIVDAYVEAGADGFFFATSYTSPLVVTKEEFAEFNRFYDEPLLQYIQQRTWFNMLHIHGNADLYIGELSQYPVEALNWESVSAGISPGRLTSPARLRSLTDKILIGGFDQFHDLYGKKEEVEKRLEERLNVLLTEVPDRRFVFGAGCSLPLDIPSENIRLVRKVADR